MSKKFLVDILAKAGLIVEGTTDLQGTATAITQSNSDNSTKLATTAFVKNQGYAADNLMVHLAGAETITGVKSFSPTVTASLGLGRSMFVDGTITASANNNTLVGLDIAPIFDASTFTGVNSYAVRISGTYANTSPSYIKLVNGGIGALTGAAIEFPFGQRILASSLSPLVGGVGFAFYDKASTTDGVGLNSSLLQFSSSTPSIKGSGNNGTLTIAQENGTSSLVNIRSGGSINFQSYVSAAFTDVVRIFRLTGNVLLQSGGTFTDAGFRLDVNGTVRLQGETRLTTLAGTGDRMVVASSSGVLSTQAIPSLSGFVPTSRQLTINGTTFDLSADRAWTISANQNARTEYEFTTNGSTATYSAVYSIGQVDVFYNGSKLSATEFTASNGTSVTLGFTPPSGQLVEVVAWETGGGVANGRTLAINGVAFDLSANRSWTIDNASLGAQAQLNGTGFVKVSGTTVSYDNSTYLTSINSSQVITALGYTPYNATNPSGYITSSALSAYLPLTGGTLTGRLTINVSNNYGVLMNRPAVTNYIGLQYSTNNTNQWFVGLRETSTNNYFVYNEVLGTDAFSISTTNNSATFSGAYGTSNGVNINGTTYATLNSNRGAFSASAGVNYGSVGVQKWFTGIYENTDNFGFYNTTLNGFPVIISTSGLTTFTKSDSSYGQVRLIGSSVESSIGFRYPSDGDATSWVIGKGAGTGTSHFGFYYGGTRMVLSPSGNLGLGVDAPTYGKLQVESTGTAAYFQGGNGGYAALAFSGNNGALVGVLTTFGGLVYIGRSNGTLGSAFGSQTDIVISSTGNVGIGQTPLQALGTTLTVNGTIVSQTGVGGGNYNENFRANRTGNGYSAIAMGGANGTVSGTGIGVWTMAATPVGLGYRFDFDYAGSTVIAFATNGSITNSTGSYGTISDISLKENITDASPKLENISKLKVRNFNLIGDKLKQIGFIAQEIEDIFPNMVDTDTKGIKSVKTTVLIPMLVKAIQEQQAQIEELKARLN